MEFGHISHSLVNIIRQILRWVTDSVATETELSSLERPLTDGSDLIGDHNFRTGRADCGNDPIGWYEDDF